jgi:hypothetical protein
VPQQRRIHLTVAPAAMSGPAATQVPADFDPAAYLILNPDVAAAGMDPRQHWMTHGQFEGRSYRP